MQRHRWFFVLFAAVAVLIPAFAQESKPTNLAWKFKEGQTFYQTMKTETKQSMKVMGSDVNQNQSQTFIFSWTPEKKEGDSWIIKQKIEGVAMDIDIGGNKIQFDSTKEQNQSNPLSDFFKALVGSEFKLTVDKDGKVTKVEGREEFVKKLTSANPQMGPLLQTILSDEALKQMADPTFAAVPNKDVKKGDTWTKDSKLAMGPIGSYTTKYTYTSEGPQDKLQKIGVKTDLTYQPPGDNPVQGGLPFKIKSADLKADKANGTILFDADKGRVDSSDMNLELKGKLSIEIGGQTTDVELAQTQKTTVKTSDTNPAKAATTSTPGK